MDNNTNNVNTQTIINQQGNTIKPVHAAVISQAIMKKDIEKIKTLANVERFHLKENTGLFMEDVINTKDIRFIRQFADIAEIDLKKYWDLTAIEAIEVNFPDLLRYLQDDLHVDFASEIQNLSRKERYSLNCAVWDAAERGDNEIVEYVIRQFKNEKTFNAAFVGAAAGGNSLVLDLLFTTQFNISNGLLNYAVQEACRNGHTEFVPCIIGVFEQFALEKNDDGLDAVDYALMQTLRTVSSLLTSNEQIEPDNHNDALKNAERLAQLLKEYHK